MNRFTVPYNGSARMWAWLHVRVSTFPSLRAFLEGRRCTGCYPASINSFVHSVVLSGASGALLFCSFPTLDLSFFAWVALIPLLWAVSDVSCTRAFFIGWVTGLVFYGFLCFPMYQAIPTVLVSDYLLLISYWGVYVALFSVGMALLSACVPLMRLTVLPALWVSLEFLRGNIFFLEFPWVLLAHSQAQFLSLIQISSLTGAYGVSFLIVLANVGVFLLLCSWRTGFIPFLVSLGCLGSVFLFGEWVLRTPVSTETVPITVIQGNVPASSHRSVSSQDAVLSRYLDLAQRSFSTSASSLVVFPENALAGHLNRNPTRLRPFMGLAAQHETPVLLGGAARPKSGTRTFQHTHEFNRAYFISSSGQLAGRYDKMKLFPFFEFLPFDGLLPWPARYQSSGYILPGHVPHLFPLSDKQFGVLICWESFFPEVVGRLVRDGADFLINITNEEPVGDTSAPYHIWALNVFRAVEYRVSIVRAANTGISGFIDPFGRIVGTVQQEGRDTFVSGFLTRDVPVRGAPTFYGAQGDVFAWSTVAVLLGVGVMVGFRRLRSSKV